jgi:hypothetical protein
MCLRRGAFHFQIIYYLIKRVKVKRASEYGFQGLPL